MVPRPPQPVRIGEREASEPRHTIFPTQEAANDHLAGIAPADDFTYGLSRSRDCRLHFTGCGRCSVIGLPCDVRRCGTVSSRALLTDYAVGAVPVLTSPPIGSGSP